MARLSMFLPPFAPDYSGAGAVFFDLNAVAVIHDASGCTGNYAGHDEPRWFGARAQVFSSGFREIDAIMGDDERVEERMLKAAKDLDPEVMALIGSPVPRVIGTDIRGIAAELEERAGIPCIGVDTTGMDYYDRGAFKAAAALLDRFAEKTESVQGRVNILGATPLDFYLGADIDALKDSLTAHGYETGMCMAFGYTLEDLRSAGRARVNIAVSHFGYLTARYMEKKFGIPYLCGLPTGEYGEHIFYEALSAVEESGESRVLGREATPEGKSGGCDHGKDGKKLLILGEQVIGNAMRTTLIGQGGFSGITLGCLFGKDDGIAAGDLDLRDEKSIRREIQSGKYDAILGDPVFRCLLPAAGGPAFIDAALYAVSGKENDGCFPALIGKAFDEWITGITV